MHDMNQPHRTPTLRAPPHLRWAYLAVALHCPRRLVRDALVAWLNRAGFRVVGQVADLCTLADLCGQCQPGTVIVDAGSDIASIFAPLAELRSSYRRTRVVVVYDELAPADLAEAQRRGLDTLVPSSVSLESFFLILHSQGSAPGAEPANRAASQVLSAQEREVLTLLSAGHSVRHIATLLNASLSTVEGCKRRIYAKLRVASKSQAVARAVGLGLVDVLEPAGPPSGDQGRPPDLTAREVDILGSIAMGHTVRQTARLLAIAEKTVENLQTRLFLKLGTHSRAGAIRAAYSLGLLDLGSEVLPRTDPLTTANGAGAHEGLGTSADGVKRIIGSPPPMGTPTTP